MSTYRSMDFFYGTATGRAILKPLLKAGLPKLLAGYLRSPLSRPVIGRCIKKHHIPMKDYPPEKYRSYAAFFRRQRVSPPPDPDPRHLISPCDGWLSVFPIDSDSSFAIKGSRYRPCDLLEDKSLGEKYREGTCLIFRLSPSDYHHYHFVDNGYIGKSHFIEGTLHSVQPIACDTYPVFRLNRRCWSLLETENFGPVVQIEVGALAVGGIVNLVEDSPFQKGQEKGRFELCGSTIVLFFEKDRIQLLPEIGSALTAEREYRVMQGMWIGCGSDDAAQ